MQVKSISLSGAGSSEIKTISFVKDLTLVLAFSVITALSAQLKIEFGPVPFTMQTFVVLLSGILLGSRKGALSQVTYLLMGLSGVPWFARGGGLAYLLSPTFGYIVGFVFASFLIGYLFERNWGKDIRKTFLALLAAETAIYSFGLLWLYRFVGSENILAAGLYPFIVGELLKLSLIIAFLSMGRNKHAKR